MTLPLMARRPQLRPYRQEAVAAIFERFTVGHRATLLVLATGLGKAQPVTEPVLTPAGWRPIGSLRIGDEVVGADGQPTIVVGIAQVGGFVVQIPEIRLVREYPYARSPQRKARRMQRTPAYVTAEPGRLEFLARI